jgi:hypothetical protein
VHPGFFTDEVYAGLSDAAQIFLLGILTQCDDQGVFEWKPASLRIHLRPLKDGSVEPILSELIQANAICSYELGGRKYGAVRNFRKFQRPKKPNSVHPTTPEIGNYTGLMEDKGEAGIVELGGVGNWFPTGGEIPPQMEDGGGNKKDGKERKKENKIPADAGPSKYFFENGIIKLNQINFDKWKSAFSYLDLAAELISLTKWAGEQGENWFPAVSGALAKRNREVKRASDERKSSPNPQQLWDPGI